MLKGQLLDNAEEGQVGKNDNNDGANAGGDIKKEELSSALQIV